MQLQLVKSISYAGEAGLLHVRCLQAEMNRALAEENWNQMRRLDQACVMLMDKLIDANQDDKSVLACALDELKTMYAYLIVQCNREVASMIH
jgi:flagellar protein FliT